MARQAAVTPPRKVGLVRSTKDSALIPLSPHPAQEEFLALIEDNRIVFGACGRRFGKTRAVAAAALHNLLLSPGADAFVSAGETRFALVVSNSREQSQILLEHARSLIRSSPALAHELVETSEHELRFRGDRALLALPCSSRSVRGYAASFIAFDEMAFFIDEEQGGPRVAQSLWSSLTPSVAQFGPYGNAGATCEQRRAVLAHDELLVTHDADGCAIGVLSHIRRSVRNIRNIRITMRVCVPSRSRTCFAARSSQRSHGRSSVTVGGSRRSRSFTTSLAPTPAGVYLEE